MRQTQVVPGRVSCRILGRIRPQSRPRTATASIFRRRSYEERNFKYFWEQRFSNSFQSKNDPFMRADNETS